MIGYGVFFRKKKSQGMDQWRRLNVKDADDVMSFIGVASAIAAIACFSTLAIYWWIR